MSLTGPQPRRLVRVTLGWEPRGPFASILTAMRDPDGSNVLAVQSGDMLRVRAGALEVEGIPPAGSRGVGAARYARRRQRARRVPTRGHPRAGITQQLSLGGSRTTHLAAPA